MGFTFLVGTSFQELSVYYKKWLRRDLNLRPWDYDSPALTTELLSLVFKHFCNHSKKKSEKQPYLPDFLHFLISVNFGLTFW